MKRAFAAAVFTAGLCAAFAAQAQPEPAPPAPPDPAPPAPSAPAAPAPTAPAASPQQPPAGYPHPPYGYQPPPPGWQPPRPGYAGSGPAYAQPPPAVDQKRAAEERRRKTARRHDGFYLRAGFGYGLLRTSSSFAGTIGSQPADEALGEFAYFGSGVALDFGIGGTPWQGVVLGYGFMAQIAHGPSVTVDTPTGEEKKTTSKDLGAAIHGLLIDVFPDPTGNLELGGLLGLARVSTGLDGDASTGLAVGIWGGYGFWADDAASFVGLLRLGYAITDSQVQSTRVSPSGAPSIIDRSDSTFTASLVMSALIH